MQPLGRLISPAEAAAELLRRRNARRRFLDFVCYTKPDYQIAPHHRLIAEKLEAVERGDITRLMVMCPPRHGKSELVSRRFPAWYLGRNPHDFFISASYGKELALDFSRDARSIVASPEYAMLFPDVRLAADSQARDRWNTNRGGVYIAAGVDSTITGRGAHILNIDDPVKGRAEAESEQVRKSTWSWYRGDAYPRLQSGAAIILTLTRWHEEDLAGWLLRQEAEEGGERWDKVVLPAVDAEGRALWEEAYPRKVLDQIRRTILEYDWNALYMQRPQPPGGSFFTQTDLLVDGQPVPVPLVDTPERVACIPVDGVFAVIDTALKTGKEHDGLAVTYFAKVAHRQLPHPLYILDWDLKQIEGGLLEKWLPTVFVRLAELAKEHRSRHGSLGAFIEDKGSGTVLLQQAANHKWPARGIDSKLTAMGKAERALNVYNYVAAGLVKFTQPAYDKVVTFKGATKNHLLSQILSFRAGTQETAADDALDTFTYGLAIGLGNREGF
jgi:hypothetical protein